MINVEFLVVAYFISIFVDWVFQWDWQAVNKSKWSKKDDKNRSWDALFTHSAIYAFLTTLGLVLCRVDLHGKLFIVFAVLFYTHMLIDNRIIVKWIMRCKGMSKESLSDPNFSYMHIGIDHRLHEMVLLILSIFIK